MPTFFLNLVFFLIQLWFLNSFFPFKGCECALVVARTSAPTMESKNSDYGSDALSTLDSELFQAENESITHSQRTVPIALRTCNISTRRGKLVEPIPNPAKKIQRQRWVQKGINPSSLFCYIITLLIICHYISLHLNDQFESLTVPPTKIPFKYEVHRDLSTRLKTLGAHSFCDLQKSVQFWNYVFTANDAFEQILKICFGARCSIVVFAKVFRLKDEIDGSLFHR